MTTPPHIEAIARAMLALEGYTPERIEEYVAENGTYWKDTVALASLAFSMSAEICAEVADGLHSTTRTNGLSAYVGNVSAAIRALASEEG